MNKDLKIYIIRREYEFSVVIAESEEEAYLLPIDKVYDTYDYGYNGATENIIEVPIKKGCTEFAHANE